MNTIRVIRGPLITKELWSEGIPIAITWVGWLWLRHLFRLESLPEIPNVRHSSHDYMIVGGTLEGALAEKVVAARLLSGDYEEEPQSSN